MSTIILSKKIDINNILDNKIDCEAILYEYFQNLIYCNVDDIIKKIQKHEFDITKIEQKSLFGLVYKKGYNIINMDVKTFNVFTNKIKPKILEIYDNKQIDIIRKYYQDNKEEIYLNICDKISKAIQHYIECKK